MEKIEAPRYQKRKPLLFINNGQILEQEIKEANHLN
jgi:hypothetical protein